MFFESEESEASVGSPSRFIASAPAGITVADVGCYGWTLARCCATKGNRYIGLDRSEPPGRPQSAEFQPMQGHHLHLGSDTADFVVASHVIEHLHTPVEFVVELGRITRQGGHVYVEAPSELSALSRANDDAQNHRFDSFWDDPTHVRPYTPGAMYRLALSAGLIPQAVRRGFSDKIPTVCMLARVPFSGSKGMRYVTLKNIPCGLPRAFKTIWPDVALTLDDEAQLSRGLICTE
jgi:SAM-dependent methyltransferase